MLTQTEIDTCRELNARLEKQGQLIAEVMCNMTEYEYFDGVELSTPTSGNKDSCGILISIYNCKPGEIPDEVVWFPDKYLFMTAGELVAEKKRIEEEASEKNVNGRLTNATINIEYTKKKKIETEEKE